MTLIDISDLNPDQRKQHLDHNGRPFENQQGNYHTKVHSGGPEHPPVGASPHYPDYVCKNSCGFHATPDSILVKCPRCQVPLVRWIRYEEKRSSVPNSPDPV